MNGLDSEIAFKDEGPETEESAPPTPITTCDMEVIIRGLERITECLREVQLASERANSDMCLVSQEARAQGQEQERRLETLKEFLQKFETARPSNTPHVDAPTASTPYGIPSRMRPEFGFQPSPVGQDEAMEPEHSTLPHIRSAHTEDHEDSRETRMESAHSTLPHIRSARTGDHEDIRETRMESARNTLPHIRNTTYSGTRAPGIRTTFGTCTSGNTTLSGTRAPGIRTMFGIRAPGNTATTETRAAETCNIDSTNDPHTRMTEGTAETYNRIPTILAIIHRCHARHQARRFRHLMERIKPSSVLGLFNLRPLRAIRAGQQGNG